MADDAPPFAKELKALRRHIEDKFSRIVLDGAQHALADIENPLRLNFFSTAMRILFEHTMDIYAPEADVIRAEWFRSERDGGSPTRWQRVRFAIQGGFSEAFITHQLGVDATPIRARLLGAINEMSKHVHGRAETVIRVRTDQDNVIQRTSNAMLEFLTIMHECRNAILEPLAEKLDEAAIDALLNETIQSVDELASHHSLDEVDVEDIRVASIGVDTIRYRVSGSVEVILQWGSNSDVRRGDGAEIGQSFPFHCDFELPLNEPWDLSLAEPIYVVDTSSWRDMFEPDESE
jgi:hypothetical protein